MKRISNVVISALFIFLGISLLYIATGSSVFLWGGGILGVSLILGVLLWFIAVDKSSRLISALCVLCILMVMCGGSLYAQYRLHYIPCQLCLAQRYCVVCCIILMLLALALHRFPRLYQRIVDVTCIGLFLGFIAAMYQLLIQYHILSEPNFCRVELPVNVSLEQLEEIIRQNTNVSCANFGPTVLGFPMSAYSAVAFMFIFVYFSLTSNSEE